ncbi:hypothetical protein BJY52DRAFT_1289091 [Lactarius psammicola]|nr:hypothetical protein BJY52DRAFT_1289091 [Lactarius psammicola]
MPRIPTASPDPVTARVIQGGIDTSTTTIPLSTPEPLASTRPPTCSYLNLPTCCRCRSVHRRPSHFFRCSRRSSVPFPPPVTTNMLPTESHSPLLAPATPGRSRPQLSTAPDLGATAGGEGTAKAALHRERDTLDPPSAVQENITTAPTSSTTGPSWRSLGAGHTGDPPHPSRGQYDIV